MKNPLVKEAIRVLRVECNRINSRTLRNLVAEKIKTVETNFEDIEDEKMDGPPGKQIIRDKDGKIIGTQG